MLLQIRYSGMECVCMHVVFCFLLFFFFGCVLGGGCREHFGDKGTGLAMHFSWSSSTFYSLMADQVNVTSKINFHSCIDYW